MNYRPITLALLTLIASSGLIRAEELDASKFQFSEAASQYHNDTPIGLFSVARSEADWFPEWLWSQAKREKQDSAGGGIVGCFGTFYRNSSSLKVLSFTRTDFKLDLVLQELPTGTIRITPVATAEKKFIFFNMPLPQGLPDGHYHLTCRLQTDASSIVGDRGNQPTSLTLEFDLKALPPPKPTADLTDAELMAEYIAAGEAMKGWAIGPMDQLPTGMLMFEFEHPRRLRWNRARYEMMHRNTSIVPMLLEKLREELPRNKGKSEDHLNFGFARDLMEILTHLRADAAAPLLVEALDSIHGESPSLRQFALDCLMKLTHLSFQRYQPHTGGNEGWCVPAIDSAALPQQNGWPATGKAAWTDLAAKYRAWLAGEGADPKQWTTLAQQRALKFLNGENREDAYFAAHFLIGIEDRNVAQKVVARLMEIYAACEKAPVGKYSGDAGQPGPWLDLAIRMGPLARPYVKTILPVIRARIAAGGFDQGVSAIGGPEVRDFLFERFSSADASLRAVGADPGKQNWEDDELRIKDAGKSFGEFRTKRWELQRETGRVFNTAADAEAWRQKYAKSTQEEWLSGALDDILREADAGSARAAFLARCLLPDLPNMKGEPVWFPPPSFFIRSKRNEPVPPLPDPFRADWLKKHRSELIFDDLAVCFRLRK